MEKKRVKTGGRKKNTINKTTADIKNIFIQVLGANLDAIQKDLDDMTGKDRVSALLKISSLVLPKPIDPVIVEDVDKYKTEFMKRLFPKRDE
jgi:hypothetical protein